MRNGPAQYEYYDDRTETVKTMTVRGTRLLVALDKRPSSEFLVGDVDKAGPVSREAELMIASFEQATPVNTATVLAIGDDCGKPLDRDAARKYAKPDGTHDEPLHLVNPIQVGDRVFLPEASKHNTMFHSVTGKPWHILVDERDVIAYSRDDGDPIPMGDRLLVEALNESEESYGDIEIPDTHRARTSIVKVVGLGSGVCGTHGQPLTFCAVIGDVVYISRMVGITVTIDGVEHLIINNGDVMAKIAVAGKVAA